MDKFMNNRFGFKCILAIFSIVLGILFLLSSAYLVQAGFSYQANTEGQYIFDEQCASCHTVGGGDVVGPDLAGVTDRREREWLVSFIISPGEMIQDGDPTATRLLEEYSGLTMPDLGLSKSEVEAVLSYIESQSGEDEGEEGGQTGLPRGSVDRGRAVFKGRVALEREGTPCSGCHSMGDFGALGGGTMGPDLTHVYTRYGEDGLISALENLPFPTMKSIFAGKGLTKQEQADLVAYFQWADANTSPTGGARATSWMWLGGGVGVGILFGFMLIFWPRQRSSLSERLRRDHDVD